MFAATGGGTVFGRRLTKTKTQSELIRDEFGEGVDHLRMAAAYAAGTAAGMMAPRLDSMRERLEPTFEKSLEMSKDKARAGARRANAIARRATGKKKETRRAKRWPMVVGGLMIAGAVAGAAGALLSRRRQKMWNEYGTTDTTTSFREEARSTVSSAAESAKDKAGDVLGQMKNATETTPPSTSSPSPQATGAGTRTGEFSAGETYRSSTASDTGSRNSRP
jgi:hypothetical protein